MNSLDATQVVAILAFTAGLALVSLLLMLWCEAAAQADLRRELQTPLTEFLADLDLYDTRPVTNVLPSVAPQDDNLTAQPHTRL